MKLLKTLYCKIAGRHEFTKTNNLELTHPVGSNKIKGYGGRVKETIIVYTCKKCGLIHRHSDIQELDNYYMYNIPKD